MASAKAKPIASPGDTHLEIDGQDVKVTNAGKVLYPATGTTKQDVIDYYRAIAPVLIPHVQGRPVTLKRWPEGVAGQMFFQKSKGAGTPSWITTHPMQHENSVKDYVLIDDEATLAWLGQMAALELHVPQWKFADLVPATDDSHAVVSTGSTPGSPANRAAIGWGGTARDADPTPAAPDRFVVDLDPGEGAGLRECAEVARLARAILQGMGLDPIPVTSGSKGIQLYARLPGNQTSAEVSEIAHELARTLQREHPDLVVSDQKKTLRRGKVLVDWSQNNGKKTTIAPYSLRGREQPTVAAPRTWAELEDPDLRQLTYREVLERVAKDGDLLAGLDGCCAPASGPQHDSKVTHRRHSRVVEPVKTRSRVVEPVFQQTSIDSDADRERSRRSPQSSVETPDARPAAFPSQRHSAAAKQSAESAKPSPDVLSAASRPKRHSAAAKQSAESPKPSPDVLSAASRPKRHSAAAKQSAESPKPSPDVVPIDPMLASMASTSDQRMLRADADRDEHQWAFEMKWDGDRTFAVIERAADGHVTGRLVSRNGVDLIRRYRDSPKVEMRKFGEILAALLETLVQNLRGDFPVVLDGELVAIDDSGRPDFHLLRRHDGRIEYMVFDIVQVGARSLVNEPYDTRRKVLEDVLHAQPPIQIPPAFDGDLDAAMTTSAQLHLEGVLAKRRSASYQPGVRSKDWLKIKHHKSQEVVVIGWRPRHAGEPNEDATRAGALLLALHTSDGSLRYVGKVGTGFTDAERRDVVERLSAAAVAEAPVDGIPRADAKDARWAAPELVGEVEFAEWTADPNDASPSAKPRLRHVSWRGWRNDKSAKDVMVED